MSNNILGVEEMIDKGLSESYNIIYEGLLDCNIKKVINKPGMIEEINEMKEYYTSIEEYEKCAFLVNCLSFAK